MSVSAKEIIVDKLARCIDSKFSYKDRLSALKASFGNIQDAELKQTVQQKNLLLTTGGMETLIHILNFTDSSIPSMDDPCYAHIDIYDKKGPDWRYFYILQADAALAMRRMLHVGCRESSSGIRRVERAVSAGVIAALVPHLKFPQYGSEYASGCIKVLSQYEQYREDVIASGALPLLCKLLQSDPVAVKTSFRNAAECLHLLSCSSVEGFQSLGILEACLIAAANPLSGDKVILCSALCAANITAGRDGSEGSGMMESLYSEVQLGLHICRALHMSLAPGAPGAQYLKLSWSQIDIIKSICLLAASRAGCSQLIASRVKEETSNRQMSIVEVLTTLLRSALAASQEEAVEIILEIFLHFSFREDGQALLRASKSCVGLVQNISKMDGSHDNGDDEKETMNQQNREAILLAKHVLFVLNGNLDATVAQAPAARPAHVPALPSRGTMAPTSKMKVKKESSSPPSSSAVPSAPAAPAPAIPLSPAPSAAVPAARRRSRLKEEQTGEEAGREQDVHPEGEVCTDVDEVEEECDDADEEVMGLVASDSDVASAVDNKLYYPHIMISYCWAQQDIILEICKQLKAAGLTYWLDVEQMHGNINDRMAEAIEGCSVVLMAISSRYKLSANCRMEAEYSQTKHKPIVPIKVEAGYDADGWLGLLTSGKLWYDASSIQAVEQNISEIICAVRPIVVAAALPQAPVVVVKGGSVTRPTTSPADPDDTSFESGGTTSASSTTAVVIDRGGITFSLSPPNMDATDIETVARIMQRFRDEIIDSVTTQLVPIVDSITVLDNRLERIEHELAKRK
jgi:hypothetical protein